VALHDSSNGTTEIASPQGSVQQVWKDGSGSLSPRRQLESTTSTKKDKGAFVLHLAAISIMEQLEIKDCRHLHCQILTRNDHLN
jgi:hypothetical protein